MTGSITIRKATPDDAGGVARVQVNTWRTAYRGMVPDSYLGDLNYEDSHV